MHFLTHISCLVNTAADKCYSSKYRRITHFGHTTSSHVVTKHDGNIYAWSMELDKTGMASRESKQQKGMG